MKTDRFKFRVWDKENECYQEKDADSCFIRYDGVLCCDFWGDGDTRPHEVVSNEDAIIELCTGLKDLNGKLIYERDVLEYTFGMGKNSSKTQWFVAWVERYTSFRMVDVAGFNYLKTKNPGWSFEQYLEFNVYGFDTHSIVCRGYEVVGNIHETKWGIESDDDKSYKTNKSYGDEGKSEVKE